MISPTLAEAMTEYGNDAYLLTISKSGPHTSHVSVHLCGNIIECAIGASAAQNISSEPNVSLFWPPNEPGGYAMIVNGVVSNKRETSGVSTTEITLTKSVLHRPGPKAPASAGHCTSDCRQLSRPK